MLKLAHAKNILMKNGSIHVYLFFMTSSLRWLSSSLDGDSANVDIVISDEAAVDLFDFVPMLSALSKLVVSSADEFNELIVGLCCEFPMISTDFALDINHAGNATTMIDYQSWSLHF